ncbi:GNAT family N-acetyltransferase [Longispora albida]|uniref:GNAT family N-acetyltransferase n=1 Tax=Longispora albida TaxID=203523 RepID=UPI00037D7E80|nr:GNAT family protein [Longispora albida]
MRLTGDRVLLREHELSDAQAWHEVAGDPEVTEYLPWRTESAEHAAGWMEKFARAAAEPDRRGYYLAIETDGVMIGAVALDRERGDHGQGEIGYYLRRSAWGQGYGTEVAGLLLRLGFEELGLHRVFAKADPENAGSRRILTKIGMREEGLIRHRYLIRGEWRDRVLYSILEDEWRQR